MNKIERECVHISCPLDPPMHCIFSIGGSTGRGCQECSPLLGSFSFIFMQLLEKNMVKIIGWRPAFLVSDLVWEILDPLLYSVLTVVYIVVVPVPRAVRSLRAVDRRSGGTYHHVHSLSSF